MIKGKCYTNLDGFRNAKWPEVFVEVPRIGELVEAEGGKRLKVVGITHKVRKVESAIEQMKIEYEPYVEIELWAQILKG